MIISPATLEDIPALCDLLRLLFTQERDFEPNTVHQATGLRPIIEDPKVGQILVARDGAAIAGMVNLLFTVSTAEGGLVALLEDMVVTPAQRNTRVGSKLMEAATACCKARGCSRITLLTDSTNEAAQRFYARQGFTLSSMVPMRRNLAENASP